MYASRITGALQSEFHELKPTNMFMKDIIGEAPSHVPTMDIRCDYSVLRPFFKRPTKTSGGQTFIYNWELKLYKNNPDMTEVDTNTLSDYTSIDLPLLFAVLHQNTIVRRIFVDIEKAPTTYAQYIVDYLATTTSLEALWVKGPSSLAEFEPLIKGVQQSHLLQLELDTIPLRLYGSQLMANLLCQPSTLTTLKLARCKLENVGANLLFRALQHNTILITLDLTENNLTPECLLSLTALLATTQTLGCLILDKNKFFGIHRCTYFFTALQKNTSLFALSCNSAGLWETDILAFLKTMAANTRLCQVELHENHTITDQTKRTLVSSIVEAHPTLHTYPNFGLSDLAMQHVRHNQARWSQWTLENYPLWVRVYGPYIEAFFITVLASAARAGHILPAELWLAVFMFLRLQDI